MAALVQFKMILYSIDAQQGNNFRFERTKRHQSGAGNADAMKL